MKNVISMLALVCAVMIGLFSCTKDKKETATEAEVISIKNFNETLLKDYNSIKDTFPEVVFYESQVEFNNIITADAVEIDNVANVFQAGEWSYQILHKGAETNVIKVHDWWLEDVKIDPTKIISLDSAITRLMMADIVKPNSKFVTLRCPLGPKVYNPGYIFGSTGRGFVKVDAINGSVGAVSSTKVSMEVVPVKVTPKHVLALEK